MQAHSFDRSLVQKVRSPGPHRGGYRGGHGGRYGGRYGGGYYGGGGGGAAAAGAIFGLAIGVMIASQAAQNYQSVEWCMRRYRSYNPNTHTWVDYHGRVRYCP